MARMALAAPSVLATSAGSEVVSMGGTAADAAVVMALVAMCSEPGVCAPGSGGFVTVDAGDGSPVVVDGYMAVPGIGFEGTAVTDTVSMEYGGGVTTTVGAGSIAVPGSFASLELVSKRYGSVPWAELLRLVADFVGSGFPLSQACRIYLEDSGKLIFEDDPAAKAALFDGDRLLETGEMVNFPGLGDSLRHIGDEGADSFYRGDMAEKIVADLESRGSSLTRQDLAAYQPEVRSPLQLSAAGWNVASNPPPAVGGMAILSAVKRIGGSPQHLDPDVWLEALVDALLVRKEFEAGLRSPSTVTVSAVDSQGIAVAATFSSGYGSGVVPSGTGLLMNNSVGELELIPGGFSALVPGERMMSNMAPTTVRRANDVVSIGSPGADRITSALVVTLVRLLWSDDSLAAAVEHPRLHPEALDPLRVAAEVGLDLHGDVRWYAEPHMFFGGVNAAGLVDGELMAHADSRRVGSAVLV